MKLFLLILVSFQFIIIRGDEPCPFNEQECQCERDLSHPKESTVFSRVYCNSNDGNLPEFKALPDAKYNITTYFAISKADLSTIPAGHFKAFEFIRWLNLNQTLQKSIQWDDTAFEGVQLLAMEVYNLDGVIPIPKAIQNLGFEYLKLSNAPSPLIFEDNSFQGVPTLSLLEIDYTTVQSISEKAFAGLEDVLVGVQLMQAKISDLSSVTKAVRGLKNFAGLNLWNNTIKEIKRDDLAGLTSLVNLDLSYNPISNIDKDAFPSELISLRCVTFENINMASFDIAPFANLFKETILPSLTNFNLFLYGGGVKSLTTTVTDKFATLGYVSTAGMNSNLETVDSSIGDLLNNVPDSYLDISFNINLKCDTLNWLSKFDCPGRINIDNTRCADHNQQPLEDYLKSVDPDSTCHESHQGGIEFFYC